MGNKRSEYIRRRANEIFSSSDDDDDQKKKRRRTNTTKERKTNRLCDSVPLKIKDGKKMASRKKTVLAPLPLEVAWPNNLSHNSRIDSIVVNGPLETNDPKTNVTSTSFSGELSTIPNIDEPTCSNRIHHEKDKNANDISKNVHFNESSGRIATDVHAPRQTKSNNFGQSELYDHERAREIYYSQAAGSLKRRIRPCCSQFYYNMVILGESPPFEGLYPCRTHYNYYTLWRKSIENTEKQRAVAKAKNTSKKGPKKLMHLQFDHGKRAQWKPHLHIYDEDKYSNTTLPIPKKVPRKDLDEKITEREFF